MGLFVRRSLIFALMVLFPVTSSLACTSFCFDTPDGPIFASNLDLNTGDGHLFVNQRGIAKEGYRESVKGETAQWVSSYGSVTFNLVGRELPWGGMNEAGLVVTTMQLNASQCPGPDDRLPLSEGGLVQYLLDNCGSVQEAIQAAAVVRLAQNECTSHYLLGDAAGDCAAIEFLGGECMIYHGETLPVRALANATYASGIKFFEKGIVPADNPGASVERMAAAAGKMASFPSAGQVSPIDYSFEVLTKTVVAPKKWWSNLFGEPYTRWNVVFDINKREIHFRTVDLPEVRTLSLASFDMACEVPMLMLEVNAELEGVIDQEFQPYNHDANLEVLRKTCDKLGIEISKEDAIELVELFESFQCADKVNETGGT